MRNIKHISVWFSIFLLSLKATGQDPNFAQYFASPLNINPALTGNINADWRMISNFRDQWIGPASPYVTGTISYDQKMFQRKMAHVAEKNSLGVGGMLMFDHAMGGIQKSNYASINLAYRQVLSDNVNRHTLGAGFGAIYGSRRIAFDRVDFQEQFTGFGFDKNMPTGEAALSNMKPYISSSAGLTYSIKNERSNIDFGIAAFHLNKPKQTFLEDEHQHIPVRKVAHMNYETFLTDQIIFNTNAIYQAQKTAKYYSFGASLGYFVGDAESTVINAGLWYWSQNGLIPYIGLQYKNMQFGASYDWTLSKLKESSRKPKTFEISIILRGIKKPDGTIPCPWK